MPEGQLQYRDRMVGGSKGPWFDIDHGNDWLMQVYDQLAFGAGRVIVKYGFDGIDEADRCSGIEYRWVKK